MSNDLQNQFTDYSTSWWQLRPPERSCKTQSTATFICQKQSGCEQKLTMQKQQQIEFATYNVIDLFPDLCNCSSCHQMANICKNSKICKEMAVPVLWHSEGETCTLHVTLSKRSVITKKTVRRQGSDLLTQVSVGIENNAFVHTIFCPQCGCNVYKQKQTFLLKSPAEGQIRLWWYRVW